MVQTKIKQKQTPNIHHQPVLRSISVRSLCLNCSPGQTRVPLRIRSQLIRETRVIKTTRQLGKLKKKDEKKQRKVLQSLQSVCARTNEFATAQGSKLGKTPSPSRIHSNQIYPGQPSPSPSQLNNPGIYTAPPPRPPHNPYSHPYSQPGPPPSNNTSFYGPGNYSLRPPSAGVNLGAPGALNTQLPGSYPGGPPLVQGQRPTTPSPATAATAVVSSLLDKFWHKP